jgi:hypothetical protein
MNSLPTTCSGCGECILYETVARTRVYRVVGSFRVYRSRCGCGNIDRKVRS